MLENKVWMLPQGLEVDMNILHQYSKGIPLMAVGDLTSRPAPEPFGPIGVGVIGRRVDELQVVV